MLRMSSMEAQTAHDDRVLIAWFVVGMSLPLLSIVLTSTL